MLELGLNIIVWTFIASSALGILLIIGTFIAVVRKEYKRRNTAAQMREKIQRDLKEAESQARKTTG